MGSNLYSPASDVELDLCKAVEDFFNLRGAANGPMQEKYSSLSDNSVLQLIVVCT